MFSILSLTQQLFSRLATFWVNGPTLLFYLVVFCLVYLQYRRAAHTERVLYGRPRHAPLQQAIESAAYGVLGGTLGSLIATWTGLALVTPADVSPAVSYLWLVAIPLGFIHPRFLCFSYAATVLGISHLALGWPRVDVPTLCGLVGLLHLVEAFLVWMSGATNPSPLVVFQPEGGAAGGFLLRRFWPVPLVLPFGTIVSGAAGAPASTLPAWWPLIPPDPASILQPGRWVFDLLPVMVILGYTDLAIATTPGYRARRGAINLLVYSAVLLGLSALGALSRPVLWAAVLFSGVGHEWLFAGDWRSQLASTPHYLRPRRGVGVLDVLPGTAAALAGLRTGSVILEVDGRPVHTRTDLEQALHDAPAYLYVLYKNGHQLGSSRIPRPDAGLVPFGVVLVPGPGDMPEIALGPRRIATLLARWWKS